MAVDDTGNWGQPAFLGSGAPEVDVDPTAVSNYFAKLAAREFTTTALLLAAVPPGNDYLARADDAPGAVWVRTAGVWVMHGVPRFASAAVRDGVLTAPAAGDRCIVGTRRYVRAGTKWHRDGFITPTVSSSTGTSATVDDDGIVQLTAITAVTLSGVDSTLFGGDEWELVLEGTSAAGAVSFQFASGGVADANQKYDWFGNGENQASADVAVTQLAASPAATSAPITNGLSPVEFHAEIRVRNAKSSTRKARGFARVLIVTTADTGQTLINAAIDHQNTTSFDGVKITFASAFTGTAKWRALG
jgi:hypothetical protein